MYYDDYDDTRHSSYYPVQENYGPEAGFPQEDPFRDDYGMWTSQSAADPARTNSRSYLDDEYEEELSFDYSTPTRPGRRPAQILRNHNGANQQFQLHGQPSWSTPTPSYASQTRSIRDQAQQSRQSNGIRLVPVSSLPDIYRSIFKFGVFNAIQSQCFDTIMNTHEDMVISAPTGSGKTVLFELAIIRLLCSGAQNVKCVYMAPTKALCTEKFNDWTKKFQHLVKCCELTGDTVDSSKKAWNVAKDATIIVTTPEKWDSLTRNWREHQDILSTMQLFLVDEVHILNETRGSTLEVCVSRMKMRGTSVRFMLLSATAPNIEDIADWIAMDSGGSGSTGHSPTKVFKFGEEYRPCRINRQVYPYSNKNQNPFQFQKLLDSRLFDVLGKNACGKPVLIFGPTRKAVTTTADVLAKEYQKTLDNKKALPWTKPPRPDCRFKDAHLNSLLDLGLGVHHAGLALDDRRLTEELYLSGHIRTLIATSTLAVGVNLPAHTVVIKGTQMWSGSAWVEYSDLDVMQMLGRAGRPQFDTEGLAIIMCSSEMEQRYRELTCGQTTLESCLHLHLTEHLNSEVGLGTISSMYSATTWLKNSFLFQRLRRNPSHYALQKDQQQTWEQRLDQLVSDSVQSLREADLLSGETNRLEATEYGDIMSRYYIQYNTMKSILDMSMKSTKKEILETISLADEFRDIRIRASDKKVYAVLKDHMDIRFPMKKVEKSADKIMILMQAVLGGIPLNSPEFKGAESQPILEAAGVLKHAVRIARAIVDTAIAKRWGSVVKHGLEIVRSLCAKAWDDRPIVLRQINQIGDKSIKVLASSGITDIATLRKQDPHRLELLLNRRPPFGRDVIKQTESLPQYSLRLTEDSITHSNGEEPVVVTLSVEVGLKGRLPAAKGSKFIPLGFACVLTVTSDNDFIDFRRVAVRALEHPKSFTVVAQLNKPSQSISVIISSEQFAGLAISSDFKPTLPPAMYPTMTTRPKTQMQADMEALLNDDPNEWKITDDEVMDLTGSQPLSQQQSSQNDGRVAPILPSGNIACNHSCKDKTKCRHMCCREGVPASKSSTSKANKAHTENSAPKRPTSNNRNEKPAPAVKKTIGEKSRVVNTMKELNKLSDATNTQRTKPIDGRLSLAAKAIPSPLTRKPSWIPSTPSFAPLEEPRGMDNEVEDLLDMEEALKPEESGYSDPAFDALLAETDFKDLLQDHRKPSILGSTNGVLKRKVEASPAQRQTSKKTRFAVDHTTPKSPSAFPKTSVPYSSGKTSSEYGPTLVPSRPKSLFPSPTPSPARPRNSGTGISHGMPDVIDLDEEIFELQDDPEADLEESFGQDGNDDPTPPALHSTFETWSAPNPKSTERASTPRALEVVAPIAASNLLQTTEETPVSNEIAPGVERTGIAAYDDFMDWVYNSGEVELVD